MRIKELYKILQANKNGKVTQSDIARATGTSRANISKLFAKNSFLNDDKLKKIEEYFNINLKNAQSGLVYMDYFPDRVVEFTENNNIKQSDKSIKTAMPSAVFPYENGAEYFICHSNDDSMFPLINKGDFLIKIEYRDKLTVAQSKFVNTEFEKYANVNDLKTNYDAFNFLAYENRRRRPL